jgi:rhodanese-related sulfurtransferase
MDQIGNHIEKIKKMKQPIITCCASGMRSAAAKATLQAKGIETFNGGNWYSLQQKIDS